MVNGTNGASFHPVISKNERLYMFSSDLCRCDHLTGSIAKSNQCSCPGWNAAEIHSCINKQLFLVVPVCCEIRVKLKCNFDFPSSPSGLDQQDCLNQDAITFQIFYYLHQHSLA